MQIPKLSKRNKRKKRKTKRPVSEILLICLCNNKLGINKIFEKRS